MKNNKAARRKAVMRLCAFAMVHDDAIQAIEESAILEIIKERKYHGNGDITQFYEDCKQALLEDKLQQQSIFVNIDNLDKQQICNELNDFIKIARADNALLDAEREAFVLICKLFKVKQSRMLWKKALERYLDVKDISQKPMLPLTDYKSIKKIIDFYRIKGPVVKGTRHVLQMEYTKHNDLENFKEQLITRKAFILFCFVAFMLFVRFPILHVLIEAKLLTTGVMHTLSHMKIGGTVLLIGIIIAMIVAIARRKKNKKNSAEVSQAINSITWWVFGVALISGFIYHEIWTLAMMISIEWLIFMREKHQTEGHNHTAMLIVLVVLAIVADIALSVTEAYLHFEPEQIGQIIRFDPKIVSAPIFLGCICFFFGKWLENDNVKKQDDLKEMETIVQCVDKLAV